MPNRVYLFEDFPIERSLELPILCSALALIWLKPLSYTIRSVGKNKKQWVYYWMILGVLAWAEANLFPQFTANYYVYYTMVKGLVCFLLGDPLNAYLFDIKPFRSLESNKFVEEDFARIEHKFEHATFKRLLENHSYLDRNMHKLEHPWATPPNTVSSLVTARLGMLAMEDQIPEQDYGRIAKLGILQTLIDNLDSPDKATLDNSLLALVALTERNKVIRSLALTFRTLEATVPILAQNERAVIRLTAARLCRNVYFLRGEAQDRFFKLDAGKYLVELLMTKDPVYCIEMVVNLLDFVRTRESKVNHLHVDYLKQHGIGEAIRTAKACHTSSEEVVEKLGFLEEVLL